MVSLIGTSQQTPAVQLAFDTERCSPVSTPNDGDVHDATSAEVTLARVCGFCHWAKEGTKRVTITGAGDGTGALKHGVTSACTNLVLSKTGQLLSSPPAKYLKATQPSSIPTTSSSSCYEHWHITGAADCDCVPAPPQR